MSDGLLNFKGYLGNANLKKRGIQVNWTPEMGQEFIKCANEPIYFAEKYINIIHVDHGLIPIKMYDYQKEILEKITNNRRVSVATSRQAGKCVFINTSIKVRNKKTGEVIETTIGDFYEMQKKEL